MKTKKLSQIISSILCEFILQNRNNPYQLASTQIEAYQNKINMMHTTTQYSKELYFDLIQKPQYGIQHKLNSKQNRIQKDSAILIHFKLTQKSNSNVSFIESWLVSNQRTRKISKNSKIDFNQELVYLLQYVLRALKCQFLMEFLNMSQQFRIKYILDYEIQINPSKKSLKRLSSLSYENIWRKQAFSDQQNKLAVTCYHSTHKKIKSIITQNKVQSRYQATKLNSKHGSQQTKPSNSGEYQLTTSTQQKGNFYKQRKTSLIQFYDQDLNITVLSNDSDSFKKSTGRIEGVYINENFLSDSPQKQDDSDDQFQLLIEESLQQAIQSGLESKNNARLKQIQTHYQHILHSLEKTMLEFFN